MTEYTGQWYWPGLANRIACATSLAVGSFGGIATYADGAVRVWSALPEILAPTEDPDAEPGVPTRVNGLDGAKSVTAGERVAFAIRDDDVAVWWGVFPYYPVAVATEPTPVPGLPPVKQISMGTHACAVTLEGEVWCWGRNSAGQLGDGTTVDRLEAKPVVGVQNAVQVAAGGAFTCALLSEGTVQCWGTHSRGQLGRGGEIQGTGPEDYFFPLAAPVPGLSEVVAIDAGSGIACAVRADGTLWCWSGNTANEIDGSPSAPTIFTSPARVPNLSTVVAVQAEGQVVCALLSDAVVWCQGSSEYTGRGLDMGLSGPGPVPLDQANDYTKGFPE